MLQQTDNNGRYPLHTQRSLFMELEEIEGMSVDQLRFRTNSEKLRERGISGSVTQTEMRELSANAVIMTFKALAGQAGATPLERATAQNIAIAKCMTGDLEGLFENVGISAEAFLDQVKNSFPNEPPREALIKFAELVVARYKAISVEDERARRRENLEDYDEFL